MRTETPSPSLHGRASEVARLTEVLDGVAAGFGRLALIEGEAGVGKSRLLAEAVAVAQPRFQVFAGAARELDADRPFGILADALGLDPRSEDSEGAEIGRLLTGAGSVTPGTPQETRYGLIEAIISLLERRATPSPVFVALEDLHWGDPSTPVALDHVRRRLGHLPLAVVGTLRTLPRPKELDRLVAEVEGGGGTLMHLSPLDEGAIEEIVRGQLGAGPGPALLALVRGAAGNPFYVTELVAALQAEGLIVERDGTADVPEGAMLPPTLRLTILRRLGFLSPETLEVLRVASILGSSFSIADLATVLGRSAADLLPVLTEALQAGVVTDAGRRAAFRHDLVREAVYEDMPLPIRRALHRDAGRALAAEGAEPRQVATHVSSGAERGDRDAVGWLRRAAQEVGARDPAIAAKMLERARELLLPGDPATTDVAAELAWSLLWSGRLDEAVALAREVIAGRPDPSLAGMLHYAVAKALVSQGRVGDSLRELEAGLSVKNLGEQERLRLLADLGLRRFHARDVEGAREAAEAALSGAREGRAVFAACAARCALSMIALYEGRIVEAMELVDESIALADADPTGELLLIGPRFYRSMVLTQADRFDEAKETIRAARGEEGQAFQSVWPAIAAVADFHVGGWDDASAEAETSLLLAQETESHVFDALAYGTLAHIAIHRNDLRRAEELLDSAQDELRDSGLARMGLAWLLWARARLDEARGDTFAILSLLDGLWELTTGVGMPAECSELAPTLVRSSLAAGSEGRAAEVAAAMNELGERMNTPSARARALRCRGLLERDPDALLEAVRVLRSGRRPIELAQACEEAAEVLRLKGRSDDAVDLLREAARHYEGPAATRDAARVEAALRTLGVRPGRRGERRRPATGWESLTPTEEQVVRLAAEGLTNREIGQRLFISPRTVSTHLTHVFGKLGITTRVQLAAEVARQGA